MMENQKGRSMIEMLGVLAIVGILSVGGITGYSKAMTKYKLNKLVEEYALFFQQLQPYIKGICLADTGGGYTLVGKYLKQLEIVPDNWVFVDGNRHIKDSFGREMAWFTRSKKYLAVDYYMQNSDKDIATKEDVFLCQKIWLDVIKPHADMLYRVYMSRGKYPLSSYGTNYCNKTDKTCISDRTISEITKTCASCGEGICVLAIDFTW